MGITQVPFYMRIDWLKARCRREFEAHGLLDTIELEHRNVCKDGFGSASDVDAVFLDLPAPWEAIKDARSVMAVSAQLKHLSSSS